MSNDNAASVAATSDAGEQAAAATAAAENTVEKDEQNPLVMDVSLCGKTPAKSKKKKRMNVSGGSLETLVKDQLTGIEAVSVSPPADSTEETIDPHAVALALVAEGGEPKLREAYQKNIQLAKKLEREVTLLKRRNDNVQKEKDRLNLEAAEAKAAQQRQQIRCKDLQKQIKTVQEVAEKMESEKATQRAELETKFQTAIDEITSKLKEGNDEREKMREENVELEAKVQEIEKECEEKFQKYQEIHVERTESLAERRKHEEVAATEQKTVSVQQQQVERELEAVLNRKAELKVEMSLYSERMGEFEESIKKSKEVFGTFGGEIEKLKDHVESQTRARDAIKEELQAIAKKTVETQDELRKLRKAIDAKTKENTKLQAQAKKLEAKRSQWQPYDDYVKAWKESQAED